MPGPPKTPATILKLRGSPRGRTRKKPAATQRATATARTIPIRPGMPRMPPHIKADAQAAELWQDITRQLGPDDVLTPKDGPALAALCAAWSRYLHAESKLSEEGQIIVIRDDKGNVKATIPNPWLRLSETNYQRFQSLSARFGLTPADRARVRSPVKKDEPTADTKARFFG